ncbi:TrkA family potassium uptake protein [candidate division KSB1 bacterium]|nr:TrkA family potassium uptake protein [bacterium]OQX60022.1 MAG: potassium transporter TrkA [candidate division KSB1 bacterium 4484_219]RKY80616.1 MAG: TrkA family potassium uptake protein [candidate division KSB1 bacterium]RKY83367.1 MAG: TrkA family potassium uptake protein [candidate division KSB1 bacterium]RKY89686.1 MAG: TrkA family potassium uptake protein [candidate division KSB1 bacterium]
MRSFTVIGLSNFGYYLTKYLVDEGFPVMVIDSDKERVDKVKSFVQKAIIADATDKETLKNLGLQDVDVVVVCLGERIDSSVLVTLHLRELGVKEIIVKSVTEDHEKILDIIGATSTVFPERDMAFRIAQSISHPNVLEYIPLGHDISVIEIVPPKEFIGKTLSELNLRNKYGIQVLVVKEMIPEKVSLIPRADYKIKDSDILVVIGKDKDLKKIQKY